MSFSALPGRSLLRLPERPAVLLKNNKPTIADLFRTDPDRGRFFRVRAGGWALDLAGLPLNRDDQARFDQGLSAADLDTALQRLRSGAEVNPTEQRGAWHMALRAQDPSSQLGPERGQLLARQRDQFLDLADEWFEGRSGLTDLIHIGIGGSDLGPRLLAEALADGQSAVKVHWLSTLDARRVQALLRRLNPATTGLVMASKSMMTEETVVQGAEVFRWLGESATQRTWVATARPDRAAEFGVAEDHVLPFPAEIGGRFSLWSSVGVSAAAAIGRPAFEALLAGAAQADEDFLRHPIAHGLPQRLALLFQAIVQRLALKDLTVVPYDPRLRLLAGHFQQLFMESLGKQVSLAGDLLDRPTIPLIATAGGTDVQHAMFQAFHQSGDDHPLLLVGSLDSQAERPAWGRRQLGHLLAQASAFARGLDDVESWRRLPGSRPVGLLLVDQLTPATLGYLLASAEHAVYTLSTLWQINPFDQWGVEEGKRLAGQYFDALGDEPTFDRVFELLDRLRGGGSIDR